MTVSQGLHVASGIAAIPLLIVKLWSVWPKLFARPVIGGVVRNLERLSILVLVATMLFQLSTGLMNIAQWYAFEFFFPTAHYAMSYLAVGAVVVHIGVKLPVIRRALGEPLDDAPRGNLPVPSRRTVLRGTWLAVATVATVGQTVPLFRKVSVLAPRSGEGPQGVPVNRTAVAAGVLRSAALQEGRSHDHRIHPGCVPVPVLRAPGPAYPRVLPRRRSGKRFTTRRSAPSSGQAGRGAPADRRVRPVVLRQAQHPRSRVLQLVQWIEAGRGFETRDTWERRVEEHTAKREALLAALGAGRDGGVLTTELLRFAKSGLSKYPFSSLDEALRAVLDRHPGLEIRRRLGDLPLIQAQLALDDCDSVENAIRLIRNGLSHGTADYDAGQLDRLAGLLRHVVRADYLWLLGCDYEPEIIFEPGE